MGTRHGWATKFGSARSGRPQPRRSFLHRCRRLGPAVLLAIATLWFCLVATPGRATLPANSARALVACPAVSAPSTPADQLMQQGRSCYEQGQFERARQTWATAEQAYRQVNQVEGIIGSQINQVQALQSLGFYAQSRELLEGLLKQPTLQSPPLVLERARVLRSLGNLYQAIGLLDEQATGGNGQPQLPATQPQNAQAALQASLALTRNRPEFASDTSITYLSLGLLERARIARTVLPELRVKPPVKDDDAVTAGPELPEIMERVLAYFEAAIAADPNSITATQAKLNQISILTSNLYRFTDFLGQELRELSTGSLNSLIYATPDLISQLFNNPDFKLELPKLQGAEAEARERQLLGIREQFEPKLRRIIQIKDTTLALTRQLITLVTEVEETLTRKDAALQSQAWVNARINLVQSLARLQSVNLATDPRSLVGSIYAVEEQFKTLQERLKQLEQEVLAAPHPAPTPKPRSAHARLKSTPPVFLSLSEWETLNRVVAASLQNSAAVLQLAIADAQTLQNTRAEATARVALAELYARSTETASRPGALWAEVEQLSRQALQLTQDGTAPDLVYRAQWQMARAFRQKPGQVAQARVACLSAAKVLQSLRSNLVAIDQDVQYTFRDSVEPFYRECVGILLPNQAELAAVQPGPGQKSLAIADPAAKTLEIRQNLESARQLIESLQLAELDNFFREACVQAQKVVIDQLLQQDGNQNTAILYPIILRNQKLGVIAKVGQQPLTYFTPAVDRDINALLQEWQQGLQSNTEQPTTKLIAQQLYQWLIQPLETSPGKIDQIDTLVFVLDGPLRNLPMAALHDGKNYLVENYAIAVSPGLQLLQPERISQQKLNVLTAGLSQPPAVFKFNALPYVTREIQLLQDLQIATKSLLETEFTDQALEQTINQSPFNVVHLATHGVFGDRKEETFLLAYNGRIPVDRFVRILQSRRQTRDEPIELLVLSACQTATGDNRIALGLAGIAIQSGARSTLASLWSVDDRSTLILIDKFYRSLLDAYQTNQVLTRAKALQLAQKELIRNRDTQNPRLWAPYVLVGNWL